MSSVLLRRRMHKTVLNIWKAMRATSSLTRVAAIDEKRLLLPVSRKEILLIKYINNQYK